jgi:hypothetical protein
MRKLLPILIILVIALAIVFVVKKKAGETPKIPQEKVAVENPLVLSLFEDVEVGNQILQNSKIGENIKIFNGIEFTLTPSPKIPIAGEETLLTYNLKIDGRPATDMETHMGVYGRGAAIHKESLEVVPVSILKKVTPHGTLEFQTIFPKKGEYLVVTQFKRAGQIITTNFSVSVI